jgi:hypothetical protein
LAQKKACGTDENSQACQDEEIAVGNALKEADPFFMKHK